MSSEVLLENSVAAAVPMPRTPVLMPLASCETMLIELVLISLKTSFRVSPRSRLTPLKLELSASLSSWLRRSLNCVIRFLRTVLPPIVAVFAGPVSPLMTPPDVAPTTDRSSVERFWMLSLPPSFDAFTLPMSEVLALIALTSCSTVAAVTPVVEAVPPALKPKSAASRTAPSVDATVVTATAPVLPLTACRP